MRHETWTDRHIKTLYTLKAYHYYTLSPSSGIFRLYKKLSKTFELFYGGDEGIQIACVPYQQLMILDIKLKPNYSLERENVFRVSIEL